MAKNTGGSAFPGIVERPAGGVPGMSLRDYFAAEAMQALIAHYGDEGHDAKCASLAYGFADAMLEEREKQ